MGRATIIGGGTNGLFTVEVDYGKAARDALVFVLSLRIAEQTALIAEQTVRVDQAAADTAAARELASIAVRDYALEATANPGGNHSALVAAVTRLTVDAARLAAIEAQLRVKRDLLKADRTEQQREKGRLESAVVSATKSAWCVDLTESAAGTVATVDIPGEDQALLLAPGCRAPMAADGKLLAREVMTPAQAFFNAAVLPGWQKWKPTYRKGTITALNKSTSLASVALDAATSSAAGLGVNRSSSLSNVPVVYMTCNAEVFEVGNRVVVEFVGMAQESPRVIGFVSNPKSCAVYVVNYNVAGPSSPVSGCTFAPSVVISNNGSLSFSQSVFAGGDCAPVNLLNNGITGNSFTGWSDGNGSASRHDTNIIANATFTANVTRTPISIFVELVLDLIDNMIDPAIQTAGVRINISSEYVIVSKPATRQSPAGITPPGFSNFDGESVTISATVGGTMTFIISNSATGMIATRS